MSEMTLRDHLRGCPVVLRPGHADRVETYELERPPKINDRGYAIAPAQTVRVTRCIDCGEATYENVSDREEVRP